MKKFALTFAATALGILLAGMILLHFYLPKITAIDQDIATLEKTRTVRALLTPITFSMKQEIYAITKNVTGDTKKILCKTYYNTSFALKTPGYFLTNYHTVAITDEDEHYCSLLLGQDTRDKNGSADTVEYSSEFTLVNSKKYSFPVSIYRIFRDKDDVAVLRISKNETDIIKNWQYVPFRSQAIDIRDGKVIPDPDNLPASSLKDEPAITMGHPIGLHFTLTKGTFGNCIFTDDEGVQYVHVISPINGGNSGGAWLSLLDYKIIGMVAGTKNDGNDGSLQSGAIPFENIVKDLKSIGLE